MKHHLLEEWLCMHAKVLHSTSKDMAQMTYQNNIDKIKMGVVA